MALSLVCSKFAEGGRIPARYTCEGEDVSPPLTWSGAPPATQSLALVCSDPDAPVGTWYHWGVFNIPPTIRQLDEAFPVTPEIGPMRQAITDFRRTGYGGPCPPKGHGVHRYRFHLMALDIPTLSLPASPPCRDIERAAQCHVIAEAVLTGTYSR